MSQVAHKDQLRFTPDLLRPVYPICDVDIVDQIEAFLRGIFSAMTGVVQLRAKNEKESAFIELARKALYLRDELSPNTKIIINDSLEVCLQTNADGVHLGQDDMDVFSARAALGEDKIVGLSTHTRSEVLSANELTEQVDYLGFGPVFASTTKSGHAQVTGLELLAEVVELSSLPVVAIGGIDLQNAASVFNCGVGGLAVISDLVKADHLQARLAAYSKLSC